MSIAEAARFPEGSAQHFEVIFSAVHERLSVYLKGIFGLSAKVSAEAARKLLGEVIFPRFPRALFGMDELAESFDDDVIAENFDLKPIRKAVASLLESLGQH